MVCVECRRVLSGDAGLDKFMRSDRRCFPKCDSISRMESRLSFGAWEFRIATSTFNPATLNGKPYSKSFLMHDDLMAGGELVFQMGPRPNLKWGTGAGNEPVSRIDGREIVPVPVIKAAGQTFTERLEISEAPISGRAVHYTIDGSEPNQTRQFTNRLSSIRYHGEGVSDCGWTGAQHRCYCERFIAFRTIGSSRVNRTTARNTPVVETSR